MRRRWIRVRSIEVSQSRSDSAAKGPSKGDEVLLRDRFVNISPHLPAVLPIAA